MELRVSMIPDFVLVFCGVAPRAYHFHILDIGHCALDIGHE